MVMQVEAPDSVVSSFELVGTLKSDCLAIGWINKHNASFVGVFGMLVIAIKSHRQDLFVPLVVPITASGLLG